MATAAAAIAAGNSVLVAAGVPVPATFICRSQASVVALYLACAKGDGVTVAPAAAAYKAAAAAARAAV